MSIPTPHIEAASGDFAETVLMPGDPVRAEFIAGNFLENAVSVNRVRGMNGYTGTYRGKPVSVMASGMGMPSMGIYAYELYNFYDVKNIIRIGSAGALVRDLPLRSIIIAMSSSTDSNFQQQYGLPGIIAPTASYPLVKKAADIAAAMNLDYKVGSVLTSDLFYNDSGRTLEWAKMGILAVEMESAALYLTAARAGKNALCICTVSDSMVTGEACTSEERQNSFTDMIRLALETA